MKQSDNQTKVLLLAPLIFLPFLVLLFWAMGGGTTSEQEKKTAVDAQINISLPGAAIRKRSEDKLSLYEQADKDSAKLAELRDVEAKQWHLHSGADTLATNFVPAMQQSAEIVASPSNPDTTGPEALERRLGELQRQLAAAQAGPSPPKAPTTAAALANASDSDAARIQQIMGDIAASNTNDPEITQLNNLLDKVIAIQHPGSYADSSKGRSRTDTVHAASADSHTPSRPVGNRFFGFTEMPVDSLPKNTITAAIYQDQTVVTNSNITLMLMEEMHVAGFRIPKGNFITGHANISSGRLYININNVIVGKTILPVSLTVYDLDGEEGINVPNSAVRDQTKQSSDVLNDVGGVTSYDPSLSAQATSAGLQTARSFLSKRIKVVKVPVYAGYQVLLKNKKN